MNDRKLCTFVSKLSDFNLSTQAFSKNVYG